MRITDKSSILPIRKKESYFLFKKEHNIKCENYEKDLSKQSQDSMIDS